MRSGSGLPRQGVQLSPGRLVMRVRTRRRHAAPAESAGGFTRLADAIPDAWAAVGTQDPGLRGGDDAARRRGAPV